MESPPAPSPPLRRSLPLWLRIVLASLGIAVVLAVAAGLLLQSWLGGQAEDALERNLHDDLSLLAPPVRSAILRGDRAGLTEIARRGGEISHLRVTVILPSGEVIAESEKPLPLANHGDRPEVVAALTDGVGSSRRRSTTFGEPFFYTARRLDDASGNAVGVLRLSLPMSEVQHTRTQVVDALFLAALLSLPIALVVAWWASRRIARPLEDMTAAATRMASGDFLRLPRGVRDDEAGRLASALGSMGHALSRMLAEGEAERVHLDAILASMQEGVLALDRDRRVLRVNGSACEGLGLRERPAAGTALESFCRVSEVLDAARLALEGEAVPMADVTMPGTAGRVLALSAVPLATPDGDVLGAVIVLRDVTVMRRLEQTRLDFVANVSHELRTPLAAMQSALETARDLEPAEREFHDRMLETATRHGRRLADIVDDLLALSRIESEGDRLERSPTPLLRTIRAAASTAVNQAAAKNVTIGVPPEQASEVLVMGNAGRLEQVWTNLITNAVKYNRPGGAVDVEVEALPAQGEALVRVKDTGHGIPAEHQPRIFERFYRVDKGRSRDQGGTGLGLAIVKHIVRSHRGRVQVESAPERGTTFVIHLPLAPG